MEKSLNLRSSQETRILFGCQDANLKLIEEHLGVKIVARGQNLLISGKETKVSRAGKLFHELLEMIRTRGDVRHQEVRYALERITREEKVNFSDVFPDRIEVLSRRQYVIPRTKGQKLYVDAIRNHDIVFGIGPAGTGKTYLAMAMAVEALKKQRVSRIILTRPAVEAGESLGFLPGNLYEKVTPYLRPLYDALYDMMEVDKVQKNLGRGVIEVAPLAYMRGRSLNAAFIILDEAQNSTPEQMKMFLTRLGFDSKTVITGDLTQSDLPGGRPTGLLQCEALLKSIAGIKFAYFTGEDVVRHELVQKIIEVYESLSGGGPKKKQRQTSSNKQDV